jgi:hypothetical protein
MKPKFLFVVIVIVLSQSLFAQVNTACWVRTLDGPTHYWDEASSVAVDDSGNVFVTGIDLVGSFSFRDMMTAKYNSSGTLQWVKTLNISSNDQSNRVLIDNSGNVVVSLNSEGNGYVIIKYSSAGDSLWTAFPSPSDIGKPPDIAIDDSNNIYLTGGWYGQGILAKYSPEGEQKWIKYYTGRDDNYIYTNRIAIDKADNIYVSGATDMTFLSYAIMLRKYNPAGDTIWVHTLYDPIFKSANVAAMKVDEDCNVVLTGYRAAGSNRSTYIVKYDSAGALKWIRQPIQKNTNAVGVDIAVDLLNNIYATGSFYHGSTNNDVFTTKYSAHGDSLWTAFYNGSGNNEDLVEAMALDRFANVYITGSTRDFINGQFNINCLTIMYDSIGKQKAIQKFDGSAHDEDHGYALALDKWNNVIVAGRTVDPVNSFDFLIIKYGENLVDVKGLPKAISSESILSQNYPNPFRENTIITWQLPGDAHVVLKVYDFIGREVKTLEDCNQVKGKHSVNFNASELPPGVYFYQLNAGEFIQTKKCYYLKN